MNRKIATRREEYDGIVWIIDIEPCDVHDHQTDHIAESECGELGGTAIYIDGIFEMIDGIEEL